MMKEHKSFEKRKQFKKYIQLESVVILPVILVVQAFLLALGMQAVTFADYNILTKWLATDNLYYLIYNLLFFYLMLQTGFCLFKRITPSFLMTATVTIVISVINNMKWVNLKECVTISDFEKLSEAVQVAGVAEFNVFSELWVCVVVGIFLLAISIVADYMLSRKICKDTLHLSTCRITLVMLAIVFVLIAAVDIKGSAVAKLTESRTADKTGPIVYFVESIFTSYLDEPYTIEEAMRSYETYVARGKELVEETQGEESTQGSDASSQVKPNVIVIMSEAFFDVNEFEGVLSYSENPMAAFEEVRQDSIVSGKTKVNIYGGSTHFSEFEFLTGWNSKGMNSGSCPYKEYFNQNQPSIARYMQQQGYYTLAIHPYDSYFWNRKNAYPNMGFDKFIDRSWMKYTDMCGYISDDALTNEIIYRYEERQNNKEEPFFCFGVSIANHVAMINREEFENTADHIEVEYNKNIGYSEKRKQRVKEYVGGISKSGEALKKLTEYFKQQEEPTVIVFFGDHAPNYAIDILKADGKEELSYETPYLIWSNYEIDNVESCPDEMNVSYLSTYLLQILRMPLAEQNYYNIAMRESYVYETRYAIANWNGDLYDMFSAEEKEIYFEYALDVKKHMPALLGNGEQIKDIWKPSSGR